MFRNRRSKLLSGRDVINLRNNSLKDIPSGCKEYAPNKSWLEKKQIQVTLETYHSLVGSERIEKRTSLSTAVWLCSAGKAKVTKKAGKIWEVFGHTIDSEDWLLPEEVLFLLETNALELFRDDVPLSIEETYTLVIGDHCSLEEYRVYSHLSRKGYRVLRHDSEITLTAYEKNIHLDQIDLAEKRSAPVTVVMDKDAGKARESALGVPEVVDLREAEKSVIAEESKSEDSSAEVRAKIEDTADAPENEVVSPEEVEVSPVCAQNLSDVDSTDVAGLMKVVENTGEPMQKLENSKEAGESSVQNVSTDLFAAFAASDAEATGVESIDPAASNLSAELFRTSVVVSDENETASNAETPRAPSANSNKWAVNEPVPLEKRVGSSPDLYIVEEDEDEVIEIDDDVEDEEEDIREVEITQVKEASDMDTVDLLDSDEDDDDVVFICQKSGNTDPSKWRQWFLTVPAFVNTTFTDEVDPSTQTPSKLKLIDMFDLGNKSIDTIMKAIPTHDGCTSFINAPDLRFIPPNIVPRFAHYKISVRSYDGSVDTHDDFSTANYSARRSVRHQNVDTSRSLSQVFQYGQEPSNFSRNPYGYSFHRTRNNSSRRVWNQFPRQNQQSRPNRFKYEQNQNGYTNEGANLNNFNHYGTNDHQNRNNSSNVQQNFNRPNNSRDPWNNQHNDLMNNFANNHNPNAFGGQQLKFALQQACQMQMLAMSLMQNSQALIQNCGAPTAFNNPPVNFNPINNFNVGNNFDPVNSFNFMNNGNPSMNQFSSNFRGRRPYRRPYMRRGSAGRRRYFNNDRGSPKITEITEVVCVDSDEEESKVLQKPAYKRMLALGAIADLNSPKRSKVITISEVDVKPGKSVKNESQTPPVKRDQLPTKTESAGSSVYKTEAAVESEGDAISSSSDVCEVAHKDAPDNITQSPVCAADHSNDSLPMEVDESAYDSIVEVDRNNASLSDSKAPGETAEAVAEEGGTKIGASDESEPSAVSGSWQSYKQKLGDHDELPSDPRAFSTLLIYDDQRASVQDVLKSLQIFGPIDETETTRESVKVSFDVYLPNQPFRKSVRLLPNYRVIVKESTSFPSVNEHNYLKETYRDNVPFLYAVVSDDSVGLYNLHSVTLPTLEDV